MTKIMRSHPRRWGLSALAAISILGGAACQSSDDEATTTPPPPTTPTTLSPRRQCMVDYTEGYNAWVEGAEAASPELEDQYWGIADASRSRGKKAGEDLLYLWQLYECGDL